MHNLRGFRFVAKGWAMKPFDSVPALLIVGLMAAPAPILAGERSDDDHRGAVLEIGATREWGLQDGKNSFGPSLAIEVTPIEHWLEIEAGISPLRSKEGTEWEADLVFKKPFQLSKNVEFMIGAGPQWTSSGSFGATGVLDFMFWVTPQYGWFVEPSFSYAFTRGHDQNLAVNVGLLIALPPH
ncbi:hypothetical protein SAMN05444159_3356 [Bradyrhizobium lablabi]|uniref:Uncharacterized protein n=2 Tax=Bradyrhizobium lablabi TaxID=722472 RepID=A0A1M6ST48_9BRAD|nr:hypothetical protein SAMN05444159_3356 [Bradyrhizobium lablabi]